MLSARKARLRRRETCCLFNEQLFDGIRDEGKVSRQVTVRARRVIWGGRRS